MFTIICTNIDVVSILFKISVFYDPPVLTKLRLVQIHPFQ